MARFVFKLQAVLRHRLHVERQKQRELAVRQKELLELQQALRQVQESVNRCNQDVRQHHLVGRLDMAFLAAHRRFLAGMQRQAIALVQRIALAQRAVDEARAALTEAAKQRKIIQKLRERQLLRWREEQAKRELSLLDEAGMQLAYRNLTNEGDG
ncbi:flagellar export protein FliJ [Fontivita pretiosa]|uniref:flagellar export protein FliJ n=1 Tax=Fontivita pretiosa TaxID=2989684 RepID=UPI003D16CAFE